MPAMDPAVYQRLYEAERLKVISSLNTMVNAGAVVPLEQVVALLPVKPEWREYKLKPRRRRG